MTSRTLDSPLSDTTSLCRRVTTSLLHEESNKVPERGGKEKSDGGGGRAEDANQMPTEAATSKEASVRPCHQPAGHKASPLFECAIFGIRDDDERAFFDGRWNAARPGDDTASRGWPPQLGTSNGHQGPFRGTEVTWNAEPFTLACPMLLIRRGFKRGQGLEEVEGFDGRQLCTLLKYNFRFSIFNFRIQ